jgi:hypothetical protein
MREEHGPPKPKSGLYASYDRYHHRQHKVAVVARSAYRDNGHRVLSGKYRLGSTGRRQVRKYQSRRRSSAPGSRIWAGFHSTVGILCKVLCGIQSLTCVYTVHVCTRGCEMTSMDFHFVSEWWLFVSFCTCSTRW